MVAELDCQVQQGDPAQFVKCCHDLIWVLFQLQVLSIVALDELTGYPIVLRGHQAFDYWEPCWLVLSFEMSNGR